jgi:acyl carrier protein
MPPGATVVNAADPDLGEVVRTILAEVLAVPVDRIRPSTAVISELGAESLDFLDFVFRLEHALGTKIPLARWAAFVKSRLPDDPSTGLTTDILKEFAESVVSFP